MRQIPTITKNLLIINVICFLAGLVLKTKGVDINELFGLHYIQAKDFSFTQFISYMFMHASWTHLFFNMFALWMFGGVIERTFGPKRYLIYYIVCGLGAALCQELSQFVQIYTMIADQGATLQDMLNLGDSDRQVLNAFTTVGASGCIYGILLAFGMSYPEERMFIFPIPFPIKAKYFVIGYAAIELLMALSQRGDGVAHIAHLGGMLFGYIMIRMWRNNTSSSFFGGSSFFGNSRSSYNHNSRSSYNHRNSYDNNHWDGYEIKDTPTILSRIRKFLGLDKVNEKVKHQQDREAARNTTSKHQADYNYNAGKTQLEKEIDAILDKIRQSGYDSLTAEEKKKLFEQR